MADAPQPSAKPPSKDWSFELGPYAVLPNKIDAQWDRFYHVTPDCHMPVIRNAAGDGWIQFWSEAANYRSVSAKSALFEDAEKSEPDGQPVFGGAYDKPGFDNGGKWLMAVHRHPVKGGKELVGFYHAQDNYGDPLKGSAAAWKSVGVAYSADEGVTWKDGGVVITSDKPKPESEPKFGGAGDLGCVWDWKSKRWALYFGTDDMMSLAVSADPDGKPGTWKKYAGPGKGFANEGLGGVGFPVGGKLTAQGEFDWGGKKGIALQPGSNPGIFWSVYLAKWLMLWNGWNNQMYISSNDDVLNPDGWDDPKEVAKSAGGTKAWHPTVVCPKGGSIWMEGQEGKLYYADNWRAPDLRDFVTRGFKLARKD